MWKPSLTQSIRSADVSEADLVEYIREHDSNTIATVAKNLGISTGKVSRMINALKERGMLERSGSNKNGKWIVR